MRCEQYVKVWESVGKCEYLGVCMWFGLGFNFTNETIRIYIYVHICILLFILFPVLPIDSFFDYYSDSAKDNMGVDWNNNLPAGYTRATFLNGVIFTAQEKNTIPLRLFYSSARQDYLTVASDEGIAYAKANNYTDMKHVAGYVFRDPWRSATTVDGLRWQKARAMIA